MAHARLSLLSFPPELIEEIIIISTLLGDTRVAATLSQTCRPFRALVYYQFHKHLWREMFLVMFDDPRPARDLRTHGRAPWNQLYLNNKGKDKFKNCHDFPWEDEYKLRIWTEAFILRRTRPPPSCSPSSSDASHSLRSTDSELCVVLETLLRVISTAAPLPYDTLARMGSLGHACCPPHPHPVFSPLLVAAHAQPALAPCSHNTTWLMRVLAHGLPCVLMTRLTAFRKDGGVEIQKTPVKWDGLLAKLVAQIGLMTPVSSTPCSSEPPQRSVLVAPPIPGPGDVNADTGGGSVNNAALTAISIIEGEAEADDGDQPETRDNGNRSQERDARDLSESSDDDDPDFVPQPEGDCASSESDEESESDIDGDEVLGTRATPATASQDGVRRLARVRVYNMAYLHPSRAFGPFLPLDPCGISSSTTKKLDSDAADEEEEEMSGLLSPAITAPPVPPIPDTNSYLIRLARIEGADTDDDELSCSLDDNGEDNDEERDRDVDDDASSSSSSSHEGGNNASPSSPSQPIATSSARKTRASKIPSDQLRFDWAWIAAARQVIELNLRDLLVGRHQGVLRALLSLEGLRSCSAPGFPAAAPPEVPAVVVGGGDEHEGGRVFEDGQGWDWAGVEGQWRRCICWLDYPDLLGNNARRLPRRFCNPALYEVMRIIPLTLRITHYSRAPPAWPGRPTIHVAGDWHTATTPLELARVRGTVEMVASGDVRWTLVTFREDGQGEWVSEGVQLGGRGSAMGVIGMWTGAAHEPSDPLGPFWMWKVGPGAGDAVGYAVPAHDTCDR